MRIDVRERRKEDEPGQWDISIQAGGVTPGKANFFNAYTLVEERPAGDTFLHLAFTREDRGGHAFLAFELNQNALIVDQRGPGSDPVPHDGRHHRVVPDPEQRPIA